MSAMDRTFLIALGILASGAGGVLAVIAFNLIRMGVEILQHAFTK